MRQTREAEELRKQRLESMEEKGGSIVVIMGFKVVLMGFPWDCCVFLFLWCFCQDLGLRIVPLAVILCFV